VLTWYYDILLPQLTPEGYQLVFGLESPEMNLMARASRSRNIVVQAQRQRKFKVAAVCPI
jgi:hypothetical protein